MHKTKPKLRRKRQVWQRLRLPSCQADAEPSCGKSADLAHICYASTVEDGMASSYHCCS